MQHKRDNHRSARRPELLLLAIFTITLLAIGCGNGQHEGPGGEHHSLMDQLKAMDDTVKPSDMTSHEWLDGIAYSHVRGVTLHDVDTFHVADRIGLIRRYPCGRCHTEPLDVMKGDVIRTGGEDDKARAHWDIQIQHANMDVMECTTCHTGNGMDSLHLLSGTRISFNESYRLCGQCHSSQAEDWVGGAHGKRLGGWATPRVSESCVGCHNPHSPQWDTRFPARASRVVTE